MSTQIYEAIVKNFLDNTAGKLIKENYFFLNHDEIKPLKKVLREVLLEQTRIEEHIDPFYFVNSKNQIMNLIEEQTGGKEVTSVKGFVTFRMKYFENILENLLDKVVEFYMVEQEYKEFIRLLRYFIEIQESKIDTLVITFVEGDYLMEDVDGKDVKEEMEAQLDGIEALPEDKLISALITAAPKKIIMKDIVKCKSAELIETIRKIFDEVQEG